VLGWWRPSPFTPSYLIFVHFILFKKLAILINNIISPLRCIPCQISCNNDKQETSRWTIYLNFLLVFAFLLVIFLRSSVTACAYAWHGYVELNQGSLFFCFQNAYYLLFVRLLVRYARGGENEIARAAKIQENLQNKNTPFLESLFQGMECFCRPKKKESTKLLCSWWWLLQKKIHNLWDKPVFMINFKSTIFFPAIYKSQISADFIPFCRTLFFL